MQLPRVIVTSIVRTSKINDVHGYVYVVNTETNSVEKEIKWESEDISFEGRGGERGLRGIEFYNEYTYIGSGTKLLEFDKNLHLLNTYSSRYLADIHEISRKENILAIASSGTDSVILFNLDTKEFIKGYAVEIINNAYKRNPFYRIINRLALPLLSLNNSLKNYKFIKFDPNKEGGPVNIHKREINKRIHINTVQFIGNKLLFSGTLSNFQFCIENDEISKYAVIPLITHNVLAYDSKRIVYNKTAGEKVVVASKNGFIKKNFKTVKFTPDEVEINDADTTAVKTNWGRGLCFYGENNRYIISGTSPATIMVFDTLQNKMIKKIQISKDIRNTIHGIEVYPY